MKKLFFTSLLTGLILLPQLLVAQSTEEGTSTAQEGQSTEGKDFWVTFMQADQNDVSDNEDKAITLALTISAQNACTVALSNPYCPNAKKVIPVPVGIKEIPLYIGRGDGQARTRMSNDSLVCYSFYSEQIDTCAIHVESTEPISLFASNRRQKSFDATNVLPTQSLLNEYLIQAIAPSDHDNKPQGTHFAIIATEDHTIVDFCPTVQTKEWYSAYGPDTHKIGDTLTTPELMKGQVFYVWTGKNSGDAADLSGTWVKARDNKKIAVFQGAPHTNLPDKIRDRDHLFSQAMPTKCWGNTFVITASLTRGRDIVRVMALEDGTEVRINGDLVHTFDFSTNPKRTFQFEIGKKGVKCTDKNHKGTLPDPLVADSSCFITTSCAAATHLFMVSNTYDDNPVGDPAMVWVNPIEQVINKINFATYGSNNTHYFNVVTNASNVASMKLDGNNFASDFHPVSGSDNQYYFARKKIGYASHSLEGDGGFIAHVYGYGDKESYGYSAGGATKPLTQYITINGKIFTPDSDNSLCGDDTVHFACHPDYEYEKIVWGFGDGQIDDTNKDSVSHYYDPGVYQAYCLIYRSSSNVCKGQSLMDSIPIRVTIGNYKIGVINTHMPSCTQKGDDNVKYTIYLSNPERVSLTGDSVSLTFDDVAKAAGFLPSMLHITDDSLVIDVPHGAEDHTDYGLKLRIGSECPNSVLDTMLSFKLEFYRNYMEQRFANVIGVMKDSFPNQILTDFEWKQVDENNNLIAVLQNQTSSVLELAQVPQTKTWYVVCFKIRDTWQSTPTNTCSCPIPMDPAYNDQLKAQPNSEALLIGQNVAHMGDQVFVNALEDGTATWYGPDGNEYATANLPKGGGLIKAPDKPGLFILKVDAGHQRTFKFLVFSK